jgi:hypothetical protein
MRRYAEWRQQHGCSFFAEANMKPAPARCKPTSSDHELS